jgi:hypothetical protein
MKIFFKKIKRFIKKIAWKYLEKMKIIYWILSANRATKNTRPILFCLTINYHWHLNLLYYGCILRNYGYPVEYVINEAIIEKSVFKKLFLLCLKFKKFNYYLFNEDSFDVRFQDENFDEQTVKKSAKNNLLYNSKIENDQNIDIIYKEQIDQNILNYKKWYHFIETCGLSTVKQVILPSGVINESAPIFDYFLRNRISIITIETYSFQTAQRVIGKNKPAINDSNVYKDISNVSLTQAEFIDQYLKIQSFPKTSSEDKYRVLGYQVQRIDTINNELNAFLNSKATTVLIAPNVIGDSSTLNIESIFINQLEWIKYTIDFVLNFDVNIVIRFHPKDRNNETYNLFELVEKFVIANNYQHVFLISPISSINTFSLCSKIKFAIVWVSTIAADMVLRNVPVISVAESLYIGYNITWKSANIISYENNIHEALNSKFEISVDMVENAKKYIYQTYYLRPFRIGKSELAGSNIFWSTNNKEDHEFHEFLTHLHE